jgi:hypothetical protein
MLRSRGSSVLQCDSAGAAKSDRQARPQKLGHRSMLPERTTKIAVQKDAADPSRILFPHRPVEAERLNQLVARELVGADIVLREHHIELPGTRRTITKSGWRKKAPG